MAVREEIWGRCLRSAPSETFDFRTVTVPVRTRFVRDISDALFGEAEPDEFDQDLVSDAAKASASVGLVTYHRWWEEVILPEHKLEHLLRRCQQDQTTSSDAALYSIIRTFHCIDRNLDRYAARSLGETLDDSDRRKWHDGVRHQQSRVIVRALHTVNDGLSAMRIHEDASFKRVVFSMIRAYRYFIDRRNKSQFVRLAVQTTEENPEEYRSDPLFHDFVIVAKRQLERTHSYV